MTEPIRGARVRRGNRRPGSLLLTVLLVLAIVASSALVFTNKVELLKLAVIISLWAAVVAAFISFIYRRQADVDQAKSRDLKLVYDLQLDREISARREYELSVETHLRRELASEMRAQSSDEVASLRAELAALRANLEIIFDTDLQHRPAIETERTTVHTFGDWGDASPGAAAPERGDRGMGPGRVISSRIDTEAAADFDPSTEESPIIDVPAEPHPPEGDWAPLIPGGAHRRPSEPELPDAGWRPSPSPPPTPPPPMPTPATEVPIPEQPRREGRRRAPEPDSPPTPRAQPAPTPPPTPPPQPTPAPQPRPEPARVTPAAARSDWRPAPAEGLFIPAGAPGSNWAAPTPEQPPVASSPPVASPVTPAAPAMTPPPVEPTRSGRHANAAAARAIEEAAARASEEARRARHSAPPEVDPGRPTPPPTLARPPLPEPPEPPARHREPDEVDEPAGQHNGGQPVSELMARLQVGSTGGGRRRRREE